VAPEALVASKPGAATARRRRLQAWAGARRRGDTVWTRWRPLQWLPTLRPYQARQSPNGPQSGRDGGENGTDGLPRETRGGEHTAAARFAPSGAAEASSGYLAPEKSRIPTAQRHTPCNLGRGRFSVQTGQKEPDPRKARSTPRDTSTAAEILSASDLRWARDPTASGPRVINAPFQPGCGGARFEKEGQRHERQHLRCERTRSMSRPKD